MSLNATLLTALLEELRPALVGARIDKIQQPQRDQVLLTLRGKGQGGKLLLATGSGSARLHLTEQQFENPQSPPMFCMLLRKHLSGAKLIAMEQPPHERIVRLKFDTYNELGEPSQKELILELIGRNCNLILADQDEIILDALRRVDEDMSRERRILPGLRYHLPAFKGKPGYGAVPDLEGAEHISAYLDQHYAARDRADRHRQQAGALQKTITNLRDRAARKLEAQRGEAQDAENRERFREQGDILTANLHVLKKGQTVLTTQNFYDPDGGEISIRLDPLKTPQQNAAAYYKRYTKAKAAEQHLAAQIAKGEQELEYLGSVLDAIERAESTADIAQIREELVGAGILRVSGGGKKQKP
ncbi:MAG: NFACT family protein, partial [Oscillospiraceae bacterium]|nr:NFACT family protein [Oscillospiraceae bacterium]